MDTDIIPRRATPEQIAACAKDVWFPMVIREACLYPMGKLMFKIGHTGGMNPVITVQWFPYSKEASIEFPDSIDHSKSFEERFAGFDLSQLPTSVNYRMGYLLVEIPLKHSKAATSPPESPSLMEEIDWAAGASGC